MSTFHFKHFSISQTRSALKVGTDAMVLGSLIDSASAEKGLDIGTGTGVLSLMVAQRNPQIEIDALEIDEESFLDCVENFKNSNWNQRLNPFQVDFLEFETSDKYDLIFSNPPFYKDGLLSQNERTSQSKHANYLSFDKLIQKSAELLSQEGTLWLIFPHTLLEHIVQLAQKDGLHAHRIIGIEGKPDRPTRCVVSFKKKESEIQNEKFVIRSNEGLYSDQYVQATIDFHSKKIT